MQHINLPIANSSNRFLKTNSPIANRTNSIDSLLEECGDLIDPEYKKWFAKLFQSVDPKTVLQLAAEARNDGRDKPKLFCYLLKKTLNKPGL